MPLIVDFLAPPALNPGLVGSKGANLALLAQHGLPCPAGFCLTTKATKSVLGRLADQSLTTPRKESEEEIFARLARIRARILQIPFPEALLAQISTALEQMNLSGAEDLAVRSSGPGEDGARYSFAGIYESIIGVEPELEEVLEAIRRCWLSFWSERAFYYRCKLGLKNLANAGGVIIQRLIQADVSGVVFTVDPLRGDRNRIVVDAVQGVGEPLVSGQSTPYEFVLTRSSEDGLRVLTSRGPDGELPYFSENEALAIARLALKAEEIFGRPQDVEWVLEEGRFFLVQSRPVSRAGRISHTPIWSNANLKEILPGVMTPLTWSLFRPNTMRAWRAYYREIGYDLPQDVELIHPIAGRLYFNMSAFQSILHEVYGVDPGMENRAMGGHQAVAFDPALLGLSRRERLRRLLRRLARAGRIMRIYRALPGKARQSFPEIQGWARQLREKLRPRPDAEALLQLLREAETVSHRHVVNHMLFTDAAGLFLYLERLLQRWLPASEHDKINYLLPGLNGMKTAEQGIQLWELSRVALREPRVRDFLESQAWQSQDAFTILRGTEFIKGLEEFLEEFGHRGPQEVELASLSWREEPSFLFTTIRSFLGTPEEANPRQAVERHALQRQKAAEQIAAVLSKDPLARVIPWRRWLFQFLLSQVKQFTVLRENSKHYLMMLQDVGRQLYRLVGLHLAKAGLLEDPSDVFFLSREEVEACLAGGIAGECRTLVCRRRQEHESLQGLSPPDVIGGFQQSVVSSQRLSGIAVSPGRIRGRARVLRHIEEASLLQPGEILVVVALDPTWTPMLLLAAGLVTEVGGLLSHGAIVAREYGMPAVVNVRNATSIIVDGEELIVDGSEGVIIRTRAAERPVESGRLSDPVLHGGSAEPRRNRPNRA